MYFAHQIEEKHDEKSFQISHIYQVDTKENTCHFYTFYWFTHLLLYYPDFLSKNQIIYQ